MAAATIATMSMTNSKCLNTPKLQNPTNTKLSKPTISLFSLHSIPKGLLLTSTKSPQNPNLAGAAIAGAIFSSLGSSDAAFAAQQIAEIAEGDNRGLALLLPVIPAIAWVLFNILQPALNQINRMRNSKGVIVGLGLGGLMMGSAAPEASASEMGMIADAAVSGDNRGQLLLFVVAPAVLWVLYNILQPALNQINRMRSQ